MKVVVSEVERILVIKWGSRSYVTSNVMLNAANGASSVWHDN